MKTILDKITEAKRKEIAQAKREVPVEQLLNGPFYDRECISLKNKLLKNGASGIIAEFKRKSPSGGDINMQTSVEEATQGYSGAGASGLSVLTDGKFFGGSLYHLAAARVANPDMPILRKDFIIDPYQIFEAKASGADVILLIAACLGKEEIQLLAEKAKELHLEVLLEIHGEEELEKITPLAELIGVNNRNLKTFSVTTETSLRLASLIPGQFVKISESGISSPEAISRLKAAGYRGFLIGETFMRTENPGMACKNLIKRENGEGRSS